MGFTVKLKFAVLTNYICYIIIYFLHFDGVSWNIFLCHHIPPQTELSHNLQQLSEKARSTTEFIQRLKGMSDKVTVRSRYEWGIILPFSISFNYKIRFIQNF